MVQELDTQELEYSVDLDLCTESKESNKCLLEKTQEHTHSIDLLQVRKITRTKVKVKKKVMKVSQTSVC